jgi:hypothetical protein
MASKKDNVELLPEDTDNNAGGTLDDADFNNLRVNFSDQEKESKALDFAPLPPGKYKATIFEVKNERCGPDSKNPGKPMWNIQFRINEGQYENRRVFTRAMLFEGALFTTSQLLKATGHPDAIETGNIPPGHTLVGEDVVITLSRQVDKYAMEHNGWKAGDPKPYKNEVKGISSLEEAGAIAGGGDNSLLPG